MALKQCSECGQKISTKATSCPHCGAALKRKTGVLTWIVAILFILFMIGMFRSLYTQNLYLTGGNNSLKNKINPEEIPLTNLLDQYKNNEVRADELYKNKIIQITGIVGDVKKDITDNIYITLGTGKYFEIPMAQCFFDNKLASQVSQVNKGNVITVQGCVKGLMMNVLLYDCSIVQPASSNYDLDKNQLEIDKYNEAIRLKPDDAAIYEKRGIAYAKLGQHQRAIEDFNEAIKLEPNNAGAYINMGNVYAELGQYQRAIEDYNEAIRAEPNHVFSFDYLNKGIFYAKLGQHQRAIEDFNEAIKLEPNNASAYSNRGVAYNTLGQYPRAIEDFNEAIRLKPDLAHAYSNRGILYLNKGNHELACPDLQKACDLGRCEILEEAKNGGFCR